MGNNIILSVLVITYNQESTISKTLDSILSQEHTYSYEILVGDDCSKDNTRGIILDYAKQYPDIIKPIFNEKNLGIVGNFYNVLKKANGKYLMECAGDDWWLSGKVKTQIEFMEKNPEVGLCYGKAKEFLEKDNSFSGKSIGKKSEFTEDLLNSNEIPALTVCYRRELALLYIERIDPLSKNWLMEDYPMWLWFSIESKIFMIDENFGVYRVIETSASHFNNVERFKNFHESEWNIRNFFSQQFLDNPIQPLDIHSELVYLYLINGEREQAVKELEFCKGIKNKIILLVFKIPFLFDLVRKIKCQKILKK